MSVVDAGRTVPPFNAASFPGIPQNSNFWTSTVRASNPLQAYVINTNYS